MAARIVTEKGILMPKYQFQGAYTGAEDLIVICDLPGNVSAAAFSLSISNSGKARGHATPLMTPEEMDQVITKSPAYRAPGKS